MRPTCQPLPLLPLLALRLCLARMAADPARARDTHRPLFPCTHRPLSESARQPSARPEARSKQLGTPHLGQLPLCLSLLSFSTSQDLPANIPIETMDSEFEMANVLIDWHASRFDFTLWTNAGDSDSCLLCSIAAMSTQHAAAPRTPCQRVT